MNKWILSAGILSLLTLLAHVFGGGPEIHDPVLESDLLVELKAVLSVIWHAITAILAINGVALFMASRHARYQKPIVLLIAGQYLAFAALFIFYGWIRLGTLAPMPQWTIFIAISVLALAGLRGFTGSAAQREAR